MEEQEVENPQITEDCEGKHHRTGDLIPEEINARLANAQEQLAKVAALQKMETDKDMLKKLQSRREYWELAVRSYRPEIFKRA